MIVIKEATVAASTVAPGITRQRLLTRDRAAGTHVHVERLTLAPGASMRFDKGRDRLAFFQVIDGEATFKGLFTDRLSPHHCVVLPPRFEAKLSTAVGTTVLFAEVPGAQAANPGDSPMGALLAVTDWMREAVFVCKQDGRKRIALVSPEIGNTTDIAAAMVIYPPNTGSPDCCHDGADTLVQVMTGRGKVYAGGHEAQVAPGDLIHIPGGERHHFRAGEGADMRFLTLHAPGKFKTMLSDPSQRSVWTSTNRDINGYETLQDQRDRQARRFVFPMAN